MTHEVLAMQLSAPTEGYLVWFQVQPYGSQHWYHRWFASLRGAKISAKGMKVLHPVIIGHDGKVY